jgi:hypothetical protein
MVPFLFFGSSASGDRIKKQADQSLPKTNHRAKRFHTPVADAQVRNHRSVSPLISLDLHSRFPLSIPSNPPLPAISLIPLHIEFLPTYDIHPLQPDTVLIGKGAPHKRPSFFQIKIRVLCEIFAPLR